MANQEHLDILKQGMKTWNRWREEHADIQPDLSYADLSSANLSEANLSKANLHGAVLYEANLSGAYISEADLSYAKFYDPVNYERDNFDIAGEYYVVALRGADLSKANLSKANLSGVHLEKAKLSSANLSGADLSRADLSSADLSSANLNRATFSSANLFDVTLSSANLNRATLTGAYLGFANFSGADLSGADLSGADLSGANLNKATLVGTNLANATLKGCSIYGIAAWDVQLDGAEQLNLTITPPDEPIITVDNLKIAQFIYLLLSNKEIRDVIDTLTTKSVLILGRLTPERKAILDALREAVRQHNYLPILFDFQRPASRDITETISTLAHLARFIIADLTDPSSIPQELQAIVPTLAVPVQPVLLEGKREYSMFSDFLKTYHWVLPVYYYRDQDHLLATLKEQVIKPAEQKVKELAGSDTRLGSSDTHTMSS